MQYQNLSNEKLIKILFDMKNKIASSEKETSIKFKKIENVIEEQKKQLQEKDNKIASLQLEIKSLKENHKKTVSIMKNEIKELKDENNKLKKIIKEKDKEIKKLNNRIDKLEKENTKLKKQKSKNSSNSSKPSSTDGFRRVIHNSREKFERNVGGQINHDGTTLGVETVNNIINSGKKNVMVEERTLLVNNKKLDGKTKNVIDIEFFVTVTKINLVYDKNADSLPIEYKNNTTYGYNLKSLVCLLNIENAIPVARTVDIIYELTSGLIKLSTGTIQNIIYELNSKVQPAIEIIKSFLLNCQVNHKDETMLYCNGESRWYHVFSNDNATYYYYHKKRGNIADVEKGLLMIFTGILVHDHLKGLYRFQCDDAECNAHILRYLKYAVEQYKRKWAQEMIDLLLKIKSSIKSEMLNGNNCLKTEDILKYEYKYYEILAEGNEEFKNDTNRYKDYNGDDMKLLRRLKKYGENHLAFMYNFNIPFDNNLAERDLRMVKAKKKISGCFRSDKGGEAYTDCKSYISTMKKQKKNLYESIKLAFNKTPVLIGC